MNKLLKIAVIFMALLLVLSLSACKKMDEDYGKSIYVEGDNTDGDNNQVLEYPEIKSSDEIMPNYLDISRFDELNYSSAYLGEKFNLKITYAGTTFTLPTDYSKLSKLGWKFMEGGKYNDDSVITAGKNIDAILCNEYGKKIDVVFYNSSKSSKNIKKCSIVKLIVPENCLNTNESDYGLFWVNGVTNQSAINNIIEYWGTPSHFYGLNSEHYYLDYYFTKENKANGITVHVDPQNDIVLSIEISRYK